MPQAAEQAETDRQSGMSPYTSAMARCLGESGGDPNNPELVHSVTNLVQGRLLEYLAAEISRIHHIIDTDSRQRMVTALLGIFSDEFFALFRKKLERRPDLALLIARRIVRGEREAGQNAGHNGNDSGSLDRLFPAIFRKYFEYRKLDSLLRILETDAEIRRIIVLSRLMRSAKELDPGILERVRLILSTDTDGLCPNLFFQYLEEGQLPQLLERIESGRWETDRDKLRQRVDSICGD